MGLVWVFLILGAVMLFGIGGGDRPIGIVLIIAALGVPQAAVRRAAQELRQAAWAEGTPGAEGSAFLTHRLSI